VGAGGSQGRGTYLRPKDLNTTVRVRDHATGKALEGADRQTTDRLSAHYSKKLSTHKTLGSNILM